MSQANEEGFLVSAVWHLGAFYTDQLQQVLDGTWEPTSYWGGIADGVVGLSDYGKAVSQEAKVLSLLLKRKSPAVSGMSSPARFTIRTGQLES